MLTRLVWSNEARTDLLDIYVMIGIEQPAAAERYFDRIETKTRLLQTQPRMGVRRSDIRPSMRMLVEAPYLILYRTDPDSDDGPLEWWRCGPSSRFPFDSHQLLIQTSPNPKGRLRPRTLAERIWPARGFISEPAAFGS